MHPPAVLRRVRMSSLASLTTKFNHFYFIPLFGFFCWYGLLFGLVGAWVKDGHHTYPQYDELNKPTPLERIGVIVEPGFFISFVIIHAFVFCISMYLEFYHRRIGKLIKFIKPTIQTRLAYASLTIGVIGQVFFVVQAIVSTVYIHNHARAKSHYAVLLASFAVLIMISLALNFTNYYIMGQYYRKYVNGERWNKFTISFILKIIWLIVTIALAVTCCVLYVKDLSTPSSILEWCFHFWYGLLMLFWTYDLYPLTELRALRQSKKEKKQTLKSKLSRTWRKEKDGSVTAINEVNSSRSEDLSPSGSLEMNSPETNNKGFDYTSFNHV